MYKIGNIDSMGPQSLWLLDWKLVEGDFSVLALGRLPRWMFGEGWS